MDALPKNARTPDKPASQFQALIARLYAVESHAQDNSLSAPERLRYRQAHSVAVLGQIQAQVLAHLHSVMPGSSLGKALHYLSAQWLKLSRYVEDGSYLRTDSQVSTLSAQLQLNPSVLKAEETTRMQTVMKNFSIYKWIEILLLIIGVGMIAFLQRHDMAAGIGVGLVLQAALTLTLDLFAEARGADYLSAVQRIAI